MVEVLGELVELEVLRRKAPGFRHRLEGSEQHLARVLLVVGALVGHAQHGQGSEIRDRLGDDVEVLAGLERDVRAEHPAEVARPHAAAVHDVLAGDGAAVLALAPFDVGDALALPAHPGDGRVLEHLRAVLPGALRERQRDVRRIPLPVLRQPDGARHIAGLQVRVARRHLVRGDLLDLDTPGAGHAGLAPDLLGAGVGQGHGDRPAAAESPSRRRSRIRACRRAPGCTSPAASWRGVARSWAIRPAACQVVPEVRRLRSSSTGSQPSFARW